MSLSAIILAAGASSRMGSPKALLDIGGETFLDRLVRLFRVRFAPVVVVLGNRAEEIRAACRCASQAELVTNADWPLGMLSSLQIGLRALPRNIEGFAFTPVDSPRIAPQTLAALADVFESGSAPLIIPRFSGRRGHPVVCSAELIPEFLNLPAGAQAREIVHRHLEGAAYVDADDPAIIEDIDDPETYRKLKEPVQTK